jgi:Beta-propeller repeat
MRTFADHVHLAVEILFAGTGLILQAHAQGGVALWTNRYNVSANSSDQAKAIAVDTKGNVLVTGYSGTVKYSDTGVPLWTNLYGGSAMAIDGGGNILQIYGYYGNSAIKYSAEGVAL